jgi:peptide/nickel transport system permease protein
MNGTPHPMIVARKVTTRLVRFVATFVIATFFTAVLMDLVPGSPAQYMAGEGATPAVIRAINVKYHFNDSVFVRYWHWLVALLHGDLGTSFLTKQPVADAIRERLPITLELAVLALLVALAIAVPTAMAAARRPGSRVDRVIGGLSSGAISIPQFALALVLIYLLAYEWKLFPIFGWTRLTADPAQNLRGAVLPVLSIAAAQAVILARVLRADLIETLQQDFIALARSKGLSTRAIMWKHALRPSAFSLLTLSGLTFATLLGGTVIVESIFLLPGIGLLVLQAISSKDLITIQGVVAFIALAFLVINLVVDLLYGVLDPRTRVRA